MRNLSDTIARLSAFRGYESAGLAVSDGRLSDLTVFGSNPGALRARVYIPADLPVSAPLVVVLHGCTQNGAGYDQGAGWSEMADANGFALLYPEQRRSNNANRCFNWFVPEDIRRDSGEALSIRQMVASMIDTHGLDPSRVYITGLSAGGAMAAVMLATYPDVFAGGAVIAGIPYGAATTMSGAFDRMRGGDGPDAVALGALVLEASDHQGPWPTLSVWHGSADNTVDHSNATMLVDQWRALHDLPAEPTRTDIVDGQPRRLWTDAAGRPIIEDFRIAGMGHGTPLYPGSDAGGGLTGPFMIDAGIASTRHIAAFWGLSDAVKPTAKHVVVKGVSATPAEPQVPRRAAGRSDTPVMTSVNKVIDDALRAAGLLR